jgi:hypothetical protein
MAKEQQCHHLTKWNDEMTGDKGETKRRRQSKPIKVQETSHNVSWAVGTFHYFVAHKLF